MADFILKAFELQGIVLLLSLPLLIWWGIPISLASPVGNILFAPIIVIFLSISFILFILELLYIPNGLAVQALELVTSCWLWMAALIPNGTVLGFACPAWWVLFIIEAIAFGCVIFIRSERLAFRTMWVWASFFVLSGMLVLWGSQREITKQIACGSGNIRIEQHNGQTFMYDEMDKHGVRNVERWVEYMLLWELTRATGRRHFDYLILARPNIWALKRAQALCKKGIVREIRIYNLNERKTMAFKNAYHDLLKLAQENLVKVTNILS